MTWTEGTTTTSQLRNLNAIAVPGSVAIAVGNQGTIVSSTDAASWTVRRSSGKDLFGVAYSASAACGWPSAPTARCHQQRRRHLDRRKAFPAPAAPRHHPQGVAVMSTTATTTGYSYMAVGTGGTILTSIDGTTWTAASSPVTADLNGLQPRPASSRSATPEPPCRPTQTAPGKSSPTTPPPTPSPAATTLYGLLRAAAAHRRWQQDLLLIQLSGTIRPAASMWLLGGAAYKSRSTLHF